MATLNRGKWVDAAILPFFLTKFLLDLPSYAEETRVMSRVQIYQPGLINDLMEKNKNLNGIKKWQKGFTDFTKDCHIMLLHNAYRFSKDSAGTHYGALITLGLANATKAATAADYNRDAPIYIIMFDSSSTSACSFSSDWQSIVRRMKRMYLKHFYRDFWPSRRNETDSVCSTEEFIERLRALRFWDAKVLIYVYSLYFSPIETMNQSGSLTIFLTESQGSQQGDMSSCFPFSISNISEFLQLASTVDGFTRPTPWDKWEHRDIPIAECHQWREDMKKFIDDAKGASQEMYYRLDHFITLEDFNRGDGEGALSDYIDQHRETDRHCPIYRLLSVVQTLPKFIKM